MDRRGRITQFELIPEVKEDFSDHGFRKENKKLYID